MKFRSIASFALVLAAATLCASASADSIIIGTNNANLPNVYPFGTPTYTGEYQQVYNGALFSGPVSITSITFFSTAGYPAPSINGSYTIDFSTTSASTTNGTGGLSTTYASNIGSNNAQFFSGAVLNTLTFTGTPFLYNPAQGNLLLDVEVLSPNPSQNVFAGGCSTNTNRIYNSGGSGTPASGYPDCGTTGYGLETQINYTPLVNPAPTPEPSSIVLLGTGLLGLAGAARRRFRKA